MVTRRSAVFNLHFSFFNSSLRTAFLATLFSWLMSVALFAVQEDKAESDTDKPERQAQLAAMRRVATGLEGPIRGDSPPTVAMIPSPPLRFTAPPRPFSHT